MKASHKVIAFIIVVFLILPGCLYIFNYIGTKKEVTRIASVFGSERCLDQIPTLVMRGKKANRGMSFASDSKHNGHSVELNIMPGAISLQNDTLIIDLQDESDVYQGRILLEGLTTVIRNEHRYLIDNGQIAWPIDTTSLNVNVLQDNKLSLKIQVKNPTEVIAPTSGIIDELSYEYSFNGNIVTETFDRAGDINNVARALSDYTGRKIMPDELCLSVSLVDNKGYKVNICGLRPKSQLCTGKKIVKGELLGITDSVISIYVEHNGVQLSAKDYLNNSLPKGKKGKEHTMNPATCHLTASQMEEDIEVLIESYKECFPFWKEHVASEAIESTMTEILANLPDTLLSTDISTVMDRLNALLHDSHVFYENNYNKQDMYYHDIEFGLEGNKLIVTLATNEYSEYLKSEIKAVDGISSDSIVRFAEKFIGGYDMDVRDYPQNLLFGILTQLYCRYHPSKRTEKNFELTLTTGEKIQVESHKGMPDLKNFQPDRSQYLNINSHNNQRYKVEILRDSVVFIGLSTFDLYDTDLDSLVGLMCDNRFSTMIFDLRNNPGGSSKIADKLIKTACGDVFPWHNQQSIINKRAGFNAFKFSLNYTLDTPVVGKEFIKDQNSDKFVCKRDVSVSGSPSDTLECHINSFFIILNEMSGSAASYFASALHRAGRALVIGREPRTAYHHMTALKTCKLRLPNSGVIWHIPLVREIFDTDTIGDIPYGRGVMPDIYIPLTFDEVAFNNGDELRNKALEKALEKVSFKIDKKWTYLKWTLLLLFLSFIFIVIIWRNSNRRN